MAATTRETSPRGLKRAASSSPSPPAVQAPPALRQNGGVHSLPPRPSTTLASSSSSSSSSSLPIDPSPSTWHLSLHPRTPTHWSTLPRALFQQPEQITTFSYDGSRTLHHDDRSLMHYHVPPPGADLDRGWKEGDYVSKDDSRNEHLDSLLYALMRLGEEGDRTRRRADVVTWRGMATRLGTALWEQGQQGGQGGWEMNAMLVKGTLYVEEHLSPDMLREKVQRRPPHPPPPDQPTTASSSSSSSSRDSNLARLTYHGSTFESWSTHPPFPTNRPFNYQSDNPWSGPVNTNTQWCSIVKTRLGSSRLILGGEVDCVDEQGRKVELKTSMVIRGARDEQRFEEKMLRFYMQSFLLGVGRVVVGFRDARSGRLQTTHDFATLDMPKLVRGKPHAWDPQAGLNLAEAVLSFVRKTIEENEEKEARRRDDEAGEKKDGDDEEKASATPGVYRIAFSPSTDGVTVRRLGEREVEEEVVGRPSGEEKEKDDSFKDIQRVGFLPASFYEFAMAREKLKE